MYYAKEIVDRLLQSEHIIIYGAGTVANEVANCLTSAPYHLVVERFMVSEMTNNPSELMGIPVIDILEGQKYYQDALIIIAAIQKYLDEMQATLRKYQFRNVIVFGFESDIWSEIRGNYYKKLRENQSKHYLILEEELNKVKKAECISDSNIHIYRACSHTDKKLQADLSKYAWELPIQVGASLTEQRISSICDNNGENISAKNRVYCELTALYWIWKHDTSKYAGLCHYRRHFELNREMLEKIAVSDIDVILTIPILNFPSVRATYAYDHFEDDWKMMLQAIKSLHPEYYETAEQLQDGVFYYAYNMFIARKEILNNYCEWLFPILSYCEEKCMNRQNRDSYQNRYIGFLAERLMSIYFLHHEKQYKIVHAKKCFLT